MVSEAFVRRHHLENQAVEIVAQEMVTDTASTFNENSCIKMVRNVEILFLLKTFFGNTHMNNCTAVDHYQFFMIKLK